LPAQPGGAQAEEEEYNRTMFIEIFPDPLCPVFISAIVPMFKAMLDFTFETLGFEPDDAGVAAAAFYNQPYFNRGYIASAFRSLSPPVQERLVSQMVNPFGHHERGMRGELSLAYVRMMVRMLRFMVSFPGKLPGLVASYRSEVAEAGRIALEDVSDGEIVLCIRDLVFGSAGRLLNYDFLMIAVIGITYQMLGTLLGRYFGEDTERLRARLISGVTGNVTMQTNKHLWDLAGVAKGSGTVTEIVRLHDDQEALALLGGTKAGQAFLAALERFLDAYGHREIRMDVLYPTWGEDPTPVISFVRSYLDADETHSPHRQQARLVRERQELTQEVDSRLSQDRLGRHVISPLFRWVLALTQTHTRERDTMHFELTRLFPPFRRLLLELGRRWSERDIIEQHEDIFFLGLDEMDSLSESPRPMREQVRDRRAEFETNKSRRWPDIIRGGQEVHTAPVASGDAPPGHLQGVAGSPGVVTGVARVIRGPEEFSKLQKDDVLVAPLTNPVWTPLFAIAGGVITEAGGILSHGAIVAREYGIPAVMSVPSATKRLRDGQTIIVDGNRGTVRLQGQPVVEEVGP
jgi:pyruvate,water dikinase